MHIYANNIMWCVITYSAAKGTQTQIDTNTMLNTRGGQTLFFATRAGIGHSHHRCHPDGTIYGGNLTITWGQIPFQTNKSPVIALLENACCQMYHIAKNLIIFRFLFFRTTSEAKNQRKRTIYFAANKIWNTLRIFFGIHNHGHNTWPARRRRRKQGKTKKIAQHNGLTAKI